MKYLFTTLSIILSLIVTGCKNQPSLQKYFVAHSESSDFIVMDISPSILNINTNELSKEEALSLKSFKKLNILALPNPQKDMDRFRTEREKVEKILEDERYQELIQMKNGTEGASVFYIGNDDSIEEFVFFGSKDDSGFIVIRVLGDQMKAEQIVSLMSVLQKSDIDKESLKPLEGLIK